MYYFIVNPSSRSGQGMEVWIQAEYTLKKEHIAYQVFFTRYSGHGTRLVHSLLPKLHEQHLVIIGGDGTVNEVLNGLPSHFPVTVSYIPVGSGNDFARGMQISPQPEESLRCLLSPSGSERIDLGKLNTGKQESVFGVSSGIGYDAEVCYEVSHSRIKKWLNRLHLGKLAYAAAAIRLLFTFRPSDMEITLDDQPPLHFQNAYFAAGMNLPYEGGGFRFCPAANCKDGKLDFMIVHNLPKWKILLLFPTAYFALHTHIRGITILQGKSMHIHSSHPFRLHRDGEFAGYSNDITLSINPEAVYLQRR